MSRNKYRQSSRNKSRTLSSRPNYSDKPDPHFSERPANVQFSSQGELLRLHYRNQRVPRSACWKPEFLSSRFYHRERVVRTRETLVPKSLGFPGRVLNAARFIPSRFTLVILPFLLPAALLLSVHGLHPRSDILTLSLSLYFLPPPLSLCVARS